MNDEMACQELVELVTDYLDGHLSPQDRERFEQHLADCDGCTTYLAQMRVTVRAVGALTPAAIEPHALDALLGVYRAWQAGDSGQAP